MLPRQLCHHRLAERDHRLLVTAALYAQRFGHQPPQDIWDLPFPVKGFGLVFVPVTIQGKSYLLRCCVRPSTRGGLAVVRGSVPR
jgi:hypothetical protein